MAKKYILRKFKPGSGDHNKVNTLINLSLLGLNSQQSIIRNSLARGASETSAYNTNNGQTLYPYDEEMDVTPFSKYRDVTKNQSETYAYFDMSYPQRVEYLRQFSQQQTIAFVLDTIADEAIVLDENNYFAHLDIDKLKSNISADSEYADELVETCDKAFKRVYSMFGWDKSNSAWNMFKKFLIEGYLAFEIIFDNLGDPKEIIGFKYLDPATLEPAIEHDREGREIKVWYQNRGDAQERMIPDTNMIYISWPTGMIGEEARISYLEGLTRSYNMLSQIENSRMIWNIQNAQKRIKVVVPVGDLSPYKADTLMNEIKAEWNEETYIDDISGEMVVNGVPKFSFTKTYFQQRSSGTVTLEELQAEGYDLSSVEPLKYFWRRFIIETKVPPNRFPIDPTIEMAHNLTADDSSVTREEYAFTRFVNRIRAIYREILLKPVWIQICLYIPKLAKSEYLKQALGIQFNEENIFTEAKQRQAIKQGIDMIGSLAQLVDGNKKPLFSVKFLAQKYLKFSDDDLRLNKAFLEQEELERIEQAKRMREHQKWNQEHQQGQPAAAGSEGGAPDFGGGDFGGLGGGDFGGGDFGGGAGDFGGGEDFGGGGGDFGADTGGGVDALVGGSEPAAAGDFE